MLKCLAAALALAGLSVSPANAGEDHQCRLLLVNDDGIDAPGIHALHDALKDMCMLVVAAPATDQSGMSHAVPDIAVGVPVRVIAFAPQTNGYAVAGTPAEAAGLGVLELAGGPIDLVVSGINAGENTGLANLYSGTINAGMEALVRGTPAIAFSQDDAFGSDFSRSMPVVRAMVREALRHKLPRGVMLNVNIPKGYKGIRVRPSRGISTVITGFSTRSGANGATIYAAELKRATSVPPGGDVAAYRDGYISVAPLALDRTAARALPVFRKWQRLRLP